MDAIAIKPLLHGFAANIALLLAVGPQSVFVLKHGLMRQNIFSIITTCLVCEIMLIGMGVLGLGGFLTEHSPIRDLVTVAGIIFLLMYGFMALRAAFGPSAQIQSEPSRPSGTLRAVVATLGVTLLNPLVYFDALILLGGLSAQHPDALRFWFLVGALMASGIWFLLLGFGARLFGPMFCYRVTWMAMNLGVTGIMWSVSWSLAGQIFKY